MYYDGATILSVLQWIASGASLLVGVALMVSSITAGSKLQVLAHAVPTKEIDRAA